MCAVGWIEKRSRCGFRISETQGHSIIDERTYCDEDGATVSRVAELVGPCWHDVLCLPPGSHAAASNKKTLEILISSRL